jgi:hypothetical protein
MTLLKICKGNPEFGFGRLLAAMQRRQVFAQAVGKVVNSPGVPATQKLRNALQQWLGTRLLARKPRNLTVFARKQSRPCQK